MSLQVIFILVGNNKNMSGFTWTKSRYNCEMENCNHMILQYIKCWTLFVISQTKQNMSPSVRKIYPVTICVIIFYLMKIHIIIWTSQCSQRKSSHYLRGKWCLCYVIHYWELLCIPNHQSSLVTAVVLIYHEWQWDPWNPGN